MKNKKSHYILKLLQMMVLLSSTITFSQAIKGIVLDAEDNNVLPYVNIYLKGTTTGVISNEDGHFSLEYNVVKKNDSLVFSYMGYRSQTIAIPDIIKNTKVFLKSEVKQLNEIVLSNKMLPYTESLMRKIVKSKKINDPNNVNKIQFTETSLMSVYLANLEKEITKKKRFKKDKEAFIADSDSTVMMPILLTREVSKHSIDRNRNLNKTEKIKSAQEGTLEQLSTIVKTTINQKIAQNINFYDENIDLLGRSFQSPITSNYKAHYNLFLTDSILVNDAKQYEFQFYPLNEKSIAFDGVFWVDAETFALTKIEAALPIEANVNFIKKLEFEIVYEKVSGSKWLVKSQKTKTIFSVVASKKRTRHFSVQKNQKYTNYQLDFFSYDAPAFSTSKSLDSITRNLGIDEPLDSLELNTINGIRQLKNNAYLKFLDRFGAMTLNGYYNMNKLDLGPYFDFYNTNGIEGHRFTIPFRTSEHLSKDFSVGAYLGYGNKDKNFKYGGNIKYLLTSKKRTVLSLDYFNDFRTIAQSRYLEFVRENPYSRGGGNVFSIFSNPNRLDFNLLKQEHLDFTVSTESSENSRYLFRLFYDSYKDNEYNRLEHKAINADGFRTLGFLADLRYSKARNFDQQFFSKIYFGTTEPVYHFTAEFGNNKITGSTSDDSSTYARFNASLKKKFLLGSTFFKLFLDGGYIFGKVPFALLNNPSGNQNLGLARFNYNLLNPVSFSSDAFANLHLSFNGGGFLFNKLPILSDLNIRESMSFKGFYGKLRNEHNQFFQLPEGLIELPREPYMELGIGVGNIFKILRVEYVRRINSGMAYKGVAVKDGIKFRIEVSF